MKTEEETSHDTGPTPIEASTTSTELEQQASPPSISSRPPSPARTSRPLAHELALMVLRAASGSSASGSSPSLLPAGWSWRTWRVVQRTGSPTSGQGWRDSDTRAYRSRLRQATVELRTGEPESSSWPTLTTARNLLSPSMEKWPAHRRLLPTLTAESYGSTNNGTRDGSTSYLTAGTESLETMARKGRLNEARVERALLPTLTASSATRGTAMRGQNAQGGPSLQEAIEMGMTVPTLTKSEATRGSQQTYARGNPTLTGMARSLSPTLCARDAKGPGPGHTKGGDDLPKKAGGHLSPEFCEWFMGYPIGWTEVETGPSPRRNLRKERRRQEAKRQAQGSESSGSGTPSSRTKRKSSAT